MRRPTHEFLKTEAGSGVILAVSALAAIALANSRWSPAYFDAIHAPVTIQIAGFSETLSVLEWIKQGLMTMFFFVAGLEIKFETLKGELANPRKLAMPILAALGGMAMPALIYLAINAGHPVVRGAWATPTATDIAFALAALAVAGRRLPASLRIFLLTLAIVDDLGAVALIGVLFSHSLRPWPLAGAAMTLAGMMALGRWKAAPFMAYALGVMMVWAFCLKSGVSTSAAGVAAALTIPVGPHKRARDGVLRYMLESLHPYVAYGVLPIFAFASAGFSVQSLSLGQALQPAPIGIIAGLFFGKQLGVFFAALVAATFKLGRKPTGATWLEIYGVSALCGVGFTMSLFIGGLAFPAADALAQTQLRLGVALGSILSLAAGALLLSLAGARRAHMASVHAD